jgi:hypothetical protein
MDDDMFVGVVRNGRFEAVEPRTSSDSLTEIAMQEARSPESGEIELSAYEGRAILVAGHDGGGWIYSARVVDEAGPLVTALVSRVFGATGSTRRRG